MKLYENQRKALELIENNQANTVTSIAKELGISYQAVIKYRKAFVSSEMVELTKMGKETKINITREGKKILIQNTFDLFIDSLTPSDNSCKVILKRFATYNIPIGLDTFSDFPKDQLDKCIDNLMEDRILKKQKTKEGKIMYEISMFGWYILSRFDEYISVLTRNLKKKLNKEFKQYLKAFPVLKGHSSKIHKQSMETIDETLEHFKKESPSAINGILVKREKTFEDIKIDDRLFESIESELDGLINESVLIQATRKVGRRKFFKGVEIAFRKASKIK